MNPNTYWNHKGQYPKTIETLQAMIPVEGKVVRPYKNKALERLRVAINAYYRLYNDGDFNTGRGRMFGIEYVSNHRKYGRFKGWQESLYDAVEIGINKIVEAAAKEQGVPLE
jgi:hypothetical protein